MGNYPVLRLSPGSDLQRAHFRNQLCIFPDLASGLILFAEAPSLPQL